jgi:hypothetical protein
MTPKIQGSPWKAIQSPSPSLSSFNLFFQGSKAQLQTHYPAHTLPKEKEGVVGHWVICQK